MAKTNKPAGRQKLEQQAREWYDRADDGTPFNAFSSEAEKQATGKEMLTAIRRGIRERKLRTAAFLRAAAIVFIIGSVSITAFLLNRQATEGAPSTTWAEYRAGRGEFKTIVLPDSSMIYLRPGTLVEVASPFLGKQRQARVVAGEAMFDVRRDPSRPFLVEAAEITTSVLGTTFIVSNQSALPDIRVKLLTGKVAVHAGDSQLGTLRPNQQISYHKASGRATWTDDVPAEQAQAWQAGEYLLKDVPMTELALAIGNVYGRDVKFHHAKLAELHITTQFNKSDRLADVLEQLKLIHGLDYRISDKEVLLMK